MVQLFSCLQFLSMVCVICVSGLALPHFSTLQWSAQYVDEGACITPPPPAAEFNTSWLVSALKDDWYVPLASRMFISTRAKYQKKNITAEFLAGLCLRFKPSTSVAIMVGLKAPSPNVTTPSPHNNATAPLQIPTSTVASASLSTRHTTEATVLGCHSDKIGEQNCMLQLNSNEILGGKSSEIESTAVWTDNSKFILLTFCSNMKKKLWALLANQRNISATDRAIVEKKVQHYGFKLNLVYPIIYDSCTKNQNGEKMRRRSIRNK